MFFLLCLTICIDTKGDEDENVPSMDTLEISKNTVHPISSHFGTEEEEEDIPDMEEFEESDNVIENDPVSMHMMKYKVINRRVKMVIYSD